MFKNIIGVGVNSPSRTTTTMPGSPAITPVPTSITIMSTIATGFARSSGLSRLKKKHPDLIQVFFLSGNTPFFMMK